MLALSVVAIRARDAIDLAIVAEAAAWLVEAAPGADTYRAVYYAVLFVSAELGTERRI